MGNDYEFELTEDQIRSAIKKYGKDYVKQVYRKLMTNKEFESFETETKSKSKVKIDLGNGGFQYKKLRPKGEF
jgi:hypothetical protein